jgi:hypothetical protein
MAKEPKSAKEVLSNLSKGKGTDPVMGLRFKGSKQHLINKKTKRLDRPSLNKKSKIYNLIELKEKPE